MSKLIEIVLSKKISHLSEFEKIVKQHKSDINKKDSLDNTALHYASAKGSIERMGVLLKHGANIEAINLQGITPLFMSVINNKVEAIKYLVSQNANLNAVDDKGRNALHISIVEDEWKSAEALLQIGIKTDVLDNNGLSIVSYAVAKKNEGFLLKLIAQGADLNIGAVPPLVEACAIGHERIANLLLQNKADVDATNQSLQPAIIAATAKGHLSIVKLLIQYKANVDAIDEQGHSPLYYAVQGNHMLIVLELLRQKADTEIDITPPLILAAHKNFANILSLLLAKGAYVDAKNELGQTALHAAASQGHTNIIEKLVQRKANINSKDNDGQNAFKFAYTNGQKETAKKIIELDFDVNLEDAKGLVPLHYAAADGDLDMIIMLVSRQADMDVMSNDKISPIRLAIQNNHQKVLEYLHKSGADMKVVEKHGETLLHAAVSLENPQAVKYLCDNGADIYAKDDKGSTPFHYSVLSESKECAKILFPYYKGLKEKIISAPTEVEFLDLAAYDVIFGFEESYRDEDDIYEFDGKPNNFKTIFDRGGIDTFDLSSYIGNSVNIDLTEGSENHVGETVFRIGPKTVIENVIGGLFGGIYEDNDADNTVDLSKSITPSRIFLFGLGEDTVILHSGVNFIILKENLGHKVIHTPTAEKLQFYKAKTYTLLEPVAIEDLEQIEGTSISIIKTAEEADVEVFMETDFHILTQQVNHTSEMPY